MGFDEFLKQYDIIDFMWEIFKGVSPTIIAIITIYVNTKINKKNKKREEFSNQVNELQKLALDIMIYAESSGKELLDAIQNSHNKELCDYYLSEYKHNVEQLLMKSNHLTMYSKTKAIILNRDKFDFTYVYEAVTQFADNLSNVHKWYNEKAGLTKREEFDDLCDEVQLKLIVLKKDMEVVIHNYCIDIAK